MHQIIEKKKRNHYFLFLKYKINWLEIKKKDMIFLKIFIFFIYIYIYCLVYYSLSKCINTVTKKAQKQIIYIDWLKTKKSIVIRPNNVSNGVCRANKSRVRCKVAFCDRFDKIYFSWLN
jgi:hypothetical protein